MKAKFYSASDYAGIRTEKFSAYYGYEQVDENDEWCFVAKINGREIKRIPSSKLKGNSFEVVDMLMAGLAETIDCLIS